MPPIVKVDKHKFGPWALIVGASSGIGQEFARQLAASGLNLVLAARRLSLLDQLGQELAQEFDIEYQAVGVDVTREDFLPALEKATHDLDLGLVISTVGTPIPGAFLTTDRQLLLDSVQLKVVAYLNIAHHFGRRLAQRGRGGLLLVSSTGGLQGVPYVANNAALEAYVLSLGEALHVELQPSGVNVTVLLPGPTDTPALRAMGLTPDDLPMKPMSAQQVAAEGLAALNANRATHIAGRVNRLMAAVLPRALATRVNGSMIGKTFAGKEAT